MIDKIRKDDRAVKKEGFTPASGGIDEKPLPGVYCLCSEEAPLSLPNKEVEGKGAGAVNSMRFGL